MSESKYSLGLDFGTESVRALAVDVATGAEVAEAVCAYAHSVMTDTLPGDDRPLPRDTALQHPTDYIESMLSVLSDILNTVSADAIVGIGLDFTACTLLPIKNDGAPLCLTEEFKQEPQAWVKLWKHHAAQPQADKINALAKERGERFLDYCGGRVSSEWLLPKAWEVLEHAPEVYDAADYFMEGGDWVVHQMTGSFSRNVCAAGYKGLWSEALGNPSDDFLQQLDPRLVGLNNKLVGPLVPSGREAGVISDAFAARSGLRPGTPVSAATIDAHCGIPGMGICKPGTLGLIMGTSGCHLCLAESEHLFSGCTGIVKDGILPGWYSYEAGQAAVGDLFGWFVKDFMGRSFDEITEQAQALKPGESRLIALDWMNGNRSILMNADLSGMILGLTLASTPAEVYRALVEGTAFGTRIIVNLFEENGLPIEDLTACGGLVKSPLIMQIYADVLNRPIQVAASGQAVALGGAIFGALAAGSERGGYDDAEQAVAAMTEQPSQTYTPNPEAVAVYDKLFGMYQQVHDYFGVEHPEMMKELKGMK